VIEAPDVASARRQFEGRSQEIALVFSDILLPDGNGLDLVQELAAAKPGLRVLLTSGFAGDDERLQKIRELGYPFLAKPYNLHALLQALGTAFAG
jgi:DNA-binding NtrC family response regulator